MRRHLHLPDYDTKGVCNFWSYVLPFCFLMMLNPSIAFSNIFESNDYIKYLEKNEPTDNFSSGKITATLMDIFPADTTICSGQVIQFAVSGVDPSISLQWSATAGSFNNPNAATPTYTNPNAGTYTIEVDLIDQNNNNIGTLNTSVTIVPPISVSVSTSGETCNQLGAIDLTTSGGSGNYNFDWLDISGSSNVEDRNNLTAGNYSIDITDDLGCLQSLTIVVPFLCSNNCTATAGTLQADSTNICFTGQPLVISASQLNAPTVPAGFTTLYVLTTGSGLTIAQANATPEFTVSNFGDYTIHTLVYDPNTLNPNNYSDGFNLNADLIQGGGSICAALDVGGAPVQVIDCSAPCTDPILIDISTSPASCSTSGTASVNVVGNNNNFTYNFSSGNSSLNTVTGLTAGNYSVTISDNVNPSCFIVENFTITGTSDPISITPTTTPTTCTQGGSISLSITGGDGNYTFDWADLGGNNDPQNRTDLAVGNYSVTVTDGTGCTAALNNITITDGCTNPTCQADAGTLQADSTNICFTGQPLLISASQLNVPTVPAGFTTLYVLTTGSGLTIAQANATPEFTVSNFGDYTIHTLVYDPNTLNPANYSDGFNLNADLIQGGGSICAALDVGGAPVQVIDCSAPCITPVVLDIITTAADCNQPNGSATVNVLGNNNNYTYNFSAGNGNSNTVTGLATGNYTVTITEIGNPSCFVIGNFTISENPLGTATITITSTSSPDCPGDATGTVTYTFTTGAGFVPNATERIVDTAGNVVSPLALMAGDYCVEIIDGDGCLAGNECFTITAPDSIVIDPLVLPTSCTQGGSITLSVTGGSGSYSYNWADVGGNNDPQNRVDLAAGNYSVMVTDGLGCTASLDDIVVADGCITCQATAGTLQADSTNICFTGNPLTISATEVSSPNVPTGFSLIYVLTTGTGLDVAQVNTTPQFSVNALGNYTIHTLVFDPTTLDPNNYSNGIDLNADLIQGGGTICGALDVAGAPIALIDCAGCIPPQVQNSIVTAATCDNADGAVTLNVAGSGTYNFAWSAGTSTSNTITGLTAGTYTYTITDATNPTCFSVDSLVIGNSDGPQVNIFSSTPASCSVSNGTAVLEPQTNNEFVWSDGGVGAIRPDLAPGVNYVTVTDVITNCINVIEVFIESASLLDIQANIISTPDCQVANGQVNLTITGGSTNYTYIWSDNPNIDAPNRDNLPGGVYSVTVIDNGPNQCIDSLTFALLENVAGADITINNPNNVVSVSCTGELDGEVLYDVTLSGGFVGNPTETIFDALGNEATNGQLAPGNYCIVVTDGNDCLAGEACFEVIDAEPLELVVQVLDADCNDLGEIATFGFGGTGILLFDWDDLPGASDPQNRFNLEAGLYDLTITDQAGCTVVANDVLVEDDCQDDCPTSEEVSLILPINTASSICVSLDSCFVDSLTTYQLLGGGTMGNSIYGSWALNDSCLVYTANDTAGVFVDTICVLANYNILTDTTCFIVTVLPECVNAGNNIIQEDSISLVTDNCVDGADYCLEIELAQVLNFSLTDNGQPFNIGNQGCNFDTTFFYSLSAFLNIAPDGPYSLTSWEVNGVPFTIDSFNVISQLVDSINGWDPTGNWILDGSVITGGTPGANYGSLNLIQINSGASTNLEVDINQIPNGTLLTIDTGFHELIITDLVTGCLDTLYANVICDDCPDYYSGPNTVVGPDCSAPTDLCLDIPFQDFIFNFEVIDNGAPYTDVRKGCGFDTLSTCYLVSALPDQGTAGPYTVDTWAVGGVTFSSSFNDLQELLTLMNGWDPSGNWVLDTNGTICGGTPGQTYGVMEITQVNTGAIAVLEPDFVILTFASAIELDTGFHQIILIDTVAGCIDTIEVNIDCDVVTGGIDTILTVQVSTTDTFCFNATDTIVSAINLCPDFADGNVAGFGFIPNTNCIEYSGVVIGLDTFCMVFEYADGTIDTAGIVIEVVPELLIGDTIPLEVIVNSVETFCIDTSAFSAPLDTIFNYCESASGNFADVEIIDPNCIEVTAFDVGGIDTACIVICDTTGFCDTTIFLIDVIPPGLMTVFDTVDIDQSYTFCPDTTELFGGIVSIENVCDSLSGTSVDFTLDPSTFCVDFDANALGTDTACLVICDGFAVCDTTIYIVTVTFPIDTILAVDDDTSTVTINPVNIDIFANDIFNPDSLVFGIISGVTNGTLVSNPDGSFTYLAEAGFCGGVDSFTYFISNGTISDTATVTIEVLCDDLFIFNGFSPNNDGINETLVIQGIDNFSENVVRIYNRWGNLVYQKEGYSNDDGWDGRFEDKDLPDGTYFYVIGDGEGNQYTGWIQLNR
ncbi:MAG: gliding motility-associated C-terminal domain-containing protein [Bacteroidota bacterium]